MSLALSRYNSIRERILFLYNILNNRLYTVCVTPTMLMSIDDLRDRPEYSQDDFLNDTGYYEEYQERTFTIPRIIDILPNMVSEKQLGFRNANHAVTEIYESIQEYLQLWCELYNKAPEFPLPPMDELRNLELLAYTLFSDYKAIKGYTNNKHLYRSVKDEQEANRRGLMGLMGLMGLNAIGKGDGDDGISFVSHLDSIQQTNYGSIDVPLSDNPIITRKAVVDSLSTPDSVHNLGEWVFKG